LQDWLANPHVVSCDLKDDKMPVTSLKLDPQIVKCLDQNMVQHFFPVQQQIIPWLLCAHNPKAFRPSDICVSAPVSFITNCHQVFNYQRSFSPEIFVSSGRLDQGKR